MSINAKIISLLGDVQGSKKTREALEGMFPEPALQARFASLKEKTERLEQLLEEARDVNLQITLEILQAHQASHEAGD